MTVPFTVGVFQQKRGGSEVWTALLPEAMRVQVTGQSEARLRETLVERLRQLLRKTEPSDQEVFHLHAGTRLQRVHVDVSVRGAGGARRIAGTFPLVCEPRWFDDRTQRLVVWHPLRPEAWFSAASLDEVAELAPHFARHAWAELTPDDVDELKATGKERLGLVSFDATPRSLLDELPSRRRGRPRAGAGEPARVLETLGVDQTARAIDGTLRLGVPREPYRTRLQHLLGGRQMRSTVLVGRPGAGKTTLLQRWIADRLDEDGYLLHRNLDRIHRVWRLSGKRIIAGMSYLGDWEQRCLDIVADARRHKGILWFEDLHLFGRIGQSRQSERSLADFFRGPVQRGDLVIVAALTPEQLQRLDDDAPALASLLVRLPVAPTTSAETQGLLLHEIRDLEQRLPVELHPFTARTVIELAGALYPWKAMPGAAIDLVRTLGDDGAARAGGGHAAIEPDDVIRLLSRQTGLPEGLLTLDEPLDPAAVEAAFARRVIGQPAATRTAAGVVLDVRAGLADPGRPLAVLLFTGPTGTGKTELATALAEYLYGDVRRLLRFDMSELSGPDAVARLIGDRFEPHGLLTTRIREQPFSVVLLDEIEKAHPAVLALLLQLFDEGRLTDAAGDTASFANAVVVMTSNLGARPSQPIGFGDAGAAVMADIARAVREFFAPELFNRIDKVVPFAPLTAAIAERIVDKELRKLLARRGLRERDVFVYASPAVVARAVAEAFDARWGARTVKRWLEDRIGTLLADEIGGGGAARMRVIRLHERDGQLAARVEPMTERAPVAARWGLEPLLELPAARLVPYAADAAARLDAVLRSPELAAAAEAARSSPDRDRLLYFIDQAHDRLGALRARLGGPPPRGDRDGDDEHDLHDLETWTHDERVTPYRGAPGPSPVVRTRRFDRRSVAAERRRDLDRDTALADLAMARFLTRRIDRLADPDAHAATVEIVRVGHGASGAGDNLAMLLYRGLFEQHGWIDGEALRTRDGRKGDEIVHHVFVLRDVLVADLLADETGTHIVQSIAAEPEIIRIQVTPGAPRAPEQVVADHQRRVAAFEAALERGSELPPNPEALLPVVRTVGYRLPMRPGEPWHVELEDFVTGWTARLETRGLGPAIAQAWWLRWSQQGEEDRP